MLLLLLLLLLLRPRRDAARVRALRARRELELGTRPRRLGITGPARKAVQHDRRRDLRGAAGGRSVGRAVGRAAASVGQGARRVPDTTAAAAP